MLTELFEIELIICIKMDLALNNLQRLIYHRAQTNKKEHNIISTRVISSHMGPMYIETPYINGLHLF